MMRQDPSKLWLPDKVQPCLWASHSTMYHQYSSIHTHQGLVAGSCGLTKIFRPCLTQVGPQANGPGWTQARAYSSDALPDKG